MTITALPPITYPVNKSIFPAQVDAFIPALSTFVDEANATAAAMNLNATTDTSASSVLIGTGSKSFTVSADKSFLGGMYLIIADTAAPSTNSMFCQVTSYAGTALVVNVIAVLGSGTKTAWAISLTASGGAGRGVNNDITELTALVKKLTSGTKVNTTSGTSIDFTSIPSWVRRITLMFSGVSAAAIETQVVQLGDAGGVELTGYLGSAYASSSAGPTLFTANFPLYPAGLSAAATLHGVMTLTLLDAATNNWAAQWQIGFSDAAFHASGTGTKALSAPLDRVRLTTAGGATAFDAGSMNILYE